MSLFIQGAKLPTVEGDKSIKAEIRCIGGKWEFGIMTGGYYCSQEWTFYPLSELPPHGNLKDADAVERNLLKMQQAQAGPCSHGVRKSRAVLRDAPTIIEAEDREV